MEFRLRLVRRQSNMREADKLSLFGNGAASIDNSPGFLVLVRQHSQFMPVSLLC